MEKKIHKHSSSVLSENFLLFFLIQNSFDLNSCKCLKHKVNSGVKEIVVAIKAQPGILETYKMGNSPSQLLAEVLTTPLSADTKSCHVEGIKQKSSQQSCSIKKAVLINFAIFTGKPLCWSLFFNTQAFRPATLFKRDSNSGVCLQMLH